MKRNVPTSLTQCGVRLFVCFFWRGSLTRKGDPVLLFQNATVRANKSMDKVFADDLPDLRRRNVPAKQCNYQLKNGGLFIPPWPLDGTVYSAFSGRHGPGMRLINLECAPWPRAAIDPTRKLPVEGMILTAQISPSVAWTTLKQGSANPMNPSTCTLDMRWPSTFGKFGRGHGKSQSGPTRAYAHQ